MGWGLLFSLLLALTIEPEASIQTTTISSTASGSTPSTTMTNSIGTGSTASTPMVSSTAAGSTASTAIVSSTAAGSTASTAIVSSTAAGSTASTAIVSSTAAGSTTSTAIVSSTAAGSTASTAIVSSTAAGSTAINPTVSSTAAGSTASTAIVSSTAAGSTAINPTVSSTTAATPSTAAMIGTTVTTTTTTTTMGSTAASINATGPINPPVLTPNNTVEYLPSPISNKDCGSSLLCAGQPQSCNPAGAGSCFFVGAKQTAGQNFEFSLSGQSDGYIGCTLSTDSSLGGGDITFICAKNKERLEFIGASLNNNALSKQPVNANSVKGYINGNTIQCTFKATVPDATTKGSATSFALAVVSGTFSPGTGDLGAPVARVQTQVLDIANTSSSTTNILNGGRPTHRALSEALLIVIVTTGLALL